MYLASYKLTLYIVEGEKGLHLFREQYWSSEGSKEYEPKESRSLKILSMSSAHLRNLTTVL